MARTQATQQPHTDLLLQAVRDEVLAYGVRRASLTSIATRAGVSRMTVYRRGGSIQQLVMDAVVEEFSTILANAAAQAAQGHGRARLVSTMLAGIQMLARAPLTTALRLHDPDLLLPYLVNRHGSNQNRIRAVLAELVERGQQDGSIRPVAPDTASLLLLHTTQDFVISFEMLDTEAGWEHLRSELALLLDRYLAPTLEEPC